MAKEKAQTAQTTTQTATKEVDALTAFQQKGYNVQEAETGDLVDTDSGEVLDVTDEQETHEETGLVPTEQVQNVPTANFNFDSIESLASIDEMISNADQYTQEIEITAEYKKWNEGEKIEKAIYAGLAKIPSNMASDRRDENGMIDVIRILDLKTRKMFLSGAIILVQTLRDYNPPCVISITCGKKTDKNYHKFEVKVLTKKR